MGAAKRLLELQIAHLGQEGILFAIGDKNWMPDFIFI
jgi:hypothetical protein